MQNDLNLVYGCQLEVGESPIWDVKHDRLLFVDIRGCGVYHELPNTGKFQKIECPQQVGCLALCDNGDLLIAMEDGIYRADSDGNLTLAHQKMHIKGRRFNDGKVGPDNGIAPGTKWEDIPEDFECPICGLGKDAFEEA